MSGRTSGRHSPRTTCWARPNETIYVHPPTWYAEHDLELRLDTTITGVDPAAHEVTLADGSRIG
jgi:NADPH-dependent 2,4-dienoyl-CoA reductase/sulfur reductase-like enzyme